MTTNFFIKTEPSAIMHIADLILLLLFVVVPCVLATPSATDTGPKTLLTQVHHVHLQTRTDIHAAQCETSSCATATITATASGADITIITSTPTGTAPEDPTPSSPNFSFEELMFMLASTDQADQEGLDVWHRELLRAIDFANKQRETVMDEDDPPLQPNAEVLFKQRIATFVRVVGEGESGVGRVVLGWRVGLVLGGWWVGWILAGV